MIITEREKDLFETHYHEFTNITKLPQFTLYSVSQKHQERLVCCAGRQTDYLFKTEGGSMSACHAAGPGSIPGRGKFPG